MKFDNFIQALLPHDKKFYALFEESTRLIVEASEVLKKLSSSEPERNEAVNRIRDLEHMCDTVTHSIFAELNATFVTPFDREDIHLLASALDDIMDYMNGSAGRFVLYKLKDCPKDMRALIDSLHQSILELKRGISMLKDIGKPTELRKVLEKINEYENQADDIFEQAVARLFEEEKDPIQIIKIKEILVGLETATDKCEDAANVLESILIKYA